ncbi:D-arabinose 5-phosphate isomerase [hydrothermal vent metagenome]|uniref:D-arabinose 5-phosphate isomerase n=1 Tax=hydrothermal vent metagenome TaxID=652676 RepID=A0A3B1CSC8_9ZZZZ
MSELKAATQNSSEKTRSLIASAKRVLKIESDAVAGLIDRIGDRFADVVQALDQCQGHVVVTGMGKSGLIGQKIAATFSSIGVPSVFLHAAEASHGDVGILSRGDVVIAISNSGETEEIVKLLPTLNRIKCTLVAMTGNTASTLAKRCDHLLDISVQEEACSIGLVPTASTTAALAMGDALAMAILDLRGFREEDFALNHPGGSLGRKLLMTVADLMHTGDEIPTVMESANIYDVIKEMSQKRLGTALIVAQNGDLKGIITDGDLRRLIEKKKDISATVASDFLGTSPRHIQKDRLAQKAVQIMEENTITSLVVSEDGKQIEGILHLQDLLKAGIN